MMGININCKKQEFVNQILNGEKTLETRKCESLDPYIGRRVGLIQTGKGKATLMGFATISKKVTYKNIISFRNDYAKHLVKKGSDYDGAKYGYELVDVERCEPMLITTRGIISRRIK